MNSIAWYQTSGSLSWTCSWTFAAVGRCSHAPPSPASCCCSNCSTQSVGGATISPLDECPRRIHSVASQSSLRSAGPIQAGSAGCWSLLAAEMSCEGGPSRMRAGYQNSRGGSSYTLPLGAPAARGTCSWRCWAVAAPISLFSGSFSFLGPSWASAWAPIIHSWFGLAWTWKCTSYQSRPASSSAFALCSAASASGSSCRTGSLLRMAYLNALFPISKQQFH